MQKESQRRSSLLSLILGENQDRFGELSPLRLFIIIITSIFLAEVLAMVVVRQLETLAYYLTTLIDAAIMVFLIFPVLYWFSFYPLIRQIKKLQQTEKALQLLSSVVEQTADTVVVTNCDGVIEYVNPAFEALTGYPKEEAIGHTPRVIKSGLHDNQFYQKLWETVLNGQVFHSEITNRKKNGEIFHEVKTITPLRNADGEITRFVATGKDITERKLAEEQLRKAYDDLELRVQERTEELRIANSELEDEIRVRRRAEGALQQSEQRLERAQEIAHLGSWELDLLTNELIWSDEVYRIFGLQPRAFGATYEAFLEAIHPDDRTAVNDAYTGSIRDGRDSYEIEHRVIKHSTGEVRIVHEKCEHFRDETGQIIRSIGMVHDITERKQAEEQLKYQATLLSNVNDAIVASDAQYHLTAWNAAAESLYGWRADEVIGRPGLGVLNTEWPDRDASEMRQTIAETGRWRGEATQQRKDGTRFPVEVSSIVLHDAYGQLAGCVSVNRDITQRKQAEEQLARSNQKLNEILTSIQDDFYVLDRDWKFVYVNPLFTAKIGKEPADFIGKSIWTMFPKHVGTVLEENFRAAMENREIRRFEVGGKYTNAWYRMTVFPSAEGITIIGSDVTEQKRIEQALRESEEKFRTAFADAAIGFAMTTPQGRYLEANRAYCLLAGSEPDELLAQDFQTLIHPEDRAENLKLIDQMLAGEMADFVIENRYLRKDGMVVWVRKSVSLVRSADGSPQWIIALVENITNRKQAEQELRAAHAQLEKRVQERTAELAAANLELSNEIAERKEIERQLRIQTAAMEAAANGIVITDPKGSILWANSAIAQISGYTKEDLIGQSTRLFNSGKHDLNFYHQMWETILAGNMWRGEITNRRKDGSLYVEEQTITPVHNDSGHLSHFIAIKQDITERNLIQAQLQESNRELTTLTISERQQRFLAEGLVESSVVVNMSLELYAVLDRIIEQTSRTIPYVKADIVLLEQDTATVVRQWGTHDSAAEETVRLENHTFKIREFPLWERICTTKSAILISNTRLENQWTTYLGMPWIRSYLGAPLIYNDQMIGIINLVSDKEYVFNDGMAKALRAFAAPAAVAIQNARLYENEQHNRKMAETLSAASVALVQTLDIQTVMETILEYARSIMPFDVALIILSEGEERYRIRAVSTGIENQQLRDSLQDQILDLLNEPVVGPYFLKQETTLIPDSREIENWNPPADLASMNCWLGIPLESMGKTLGMLLIAHAVPHTFKKNQIQLAEAVVKQAVVALQNAWLFEQVRSGRERLQQLSRHLVEIQENERKYIARELHDETSQSLTSLKMGLQLIEQKAAGHEDLMEQVGKLKHLADETLESLHRLAVNLRPASLDHLKLEDALTGLIESTRQRSGLAAHFKSIGEVQADCVTEEIETSIYRIVQESITNVIRHAHATYVDVILEWQTDKIVTIIEDDGIGIDMEKAKETGHLGLIGMQERAEMLGGSMLVDSTPQAGTTLVVEIPYVNSNIDRR